MSDPAGTPLDMKQAYSVVEVAGLLGLTPVATRQLVESIFEGPRDVLSFQDLVLLRTARGLSEQKVPKTHAASGQQLLDLDRSQGRGASWLRPVPSRDADALFASALRLEESDPRGALEAYAEAVAADPHHADAHVNLGRLLHQHGRLREAEAHYVAALVSRPTDSTACFNLAVVLEDLGRLDDAIARYRETLELDAHVVDAYFNLSRLYEKKGEKLAAIRNLKDYARLSSPR